ncbi:MAG: hypothetical protein M4579_000347 [Chaenotheca gracillima]|nr:MAG: hypothetical protein M4579_000347 [Chaenotheca gracillima]
MPPQGSQSSLPPSHQPELHPKPDWTHQPRHHPLVARPSRTLFDPWNSSSTGHQTAENKLGSSTGWRDSRSAKLTAQLDGGREGGKRVADRVGAGAPDVHPEAKGVGEWRNVKDMLAPSTKKPGLNTGTKRKRELEGDCVSPALENKPEQSQMQTKRAEQRLFDGLVFYVNGSTTPLVSDHMLKYQIAQSGGRVAIHLGRRQVTHVIIGRPIGRQDSEMTSNQPGQGRVEAGGGMAAGKLQKEVKRVGGCGVKYIGVEWVLESIKAGKRLPEARYPGVRTTAAGQKSVYDIFSGPKSSNADKVEISTKSNHD